MEKPLVSVRKMTLHSKSGTGNPIPVSVLRLLDRIPEFRYPDTENSGIRCRYRKSEAGFGFPGWNFHMKSAGLTIRGVFREIKKFVGDGFRTRNPPSNCRGGVLRKKAWFLIYFSGFLPLTPLKP